jgi:hypothetical protein
MKELFPDPVTPMSRTATSALISFFIASGLRGLGTSCVCLFCSSVRMLESRDPMAEPLTGEAGGDSMSAIEDIGRGEGNTSREYDLISVPGGFKTRF